MRPLLMLAALLASALALAQSDKSPTVYINGTPIKGTLVTVGGKQFVQLPLNELKKSGAMAEGGSNGVKAIQGCTGRPLFNGVLRLTLLSAGVKNGKYVIDFKAANGASSNLTPSNDAWLNVYGIFVAGDKAQVQKVDAVTDPAYSSKTLTPGAGLNVSFVVNKPPSFEVTRILYRPDETTLNEQRDRGNKPFAQVSNMEFALKCK